MGTRKKATRTATLTAGATELQVQGLKLGTVRFSIEGTSPLVMHRFGPKARLAMHKDQAAGDVAKSTKKKTAKDFKAQYEDAMHKSSSGWVGIPAGSFGAAMISACRTIGVVMTRAKLALWVEPDGFTDDGEGLVKITKGKPHYDERPVRLPNGSFDLRARPMFNPGWQAVVTITFDQDMISLESIVNLLTRAGRQVGILEGRPDSKKSTGMGWGLFKVINQK